MCKKKGVISKKNGFTLVEVLVVIVIIGILAGAMMLSSKASSSSAEASNLVSDLRSAKAAAILWFANHISSDDSSLAGVWTGVNMPGIIAGYVDNRNKASNLVYYVSGGVFLVGRPGVPRQVVDKAIGMATGMLLDQNGVALTVGGGGGTVCIKVK